MMEAIISAVLLFGCYAIGYHHGEKDFKARTEDWQQANKDTRGE